MALFSSKVSLEQHEGELADVHAELEELREKFAEPGKWFESVLRRRVIVHLKNDQSVDGSLVASMEDGILLRGAQMLNGNGSATSMAGEVFIPRDNVAFAQLDE